MLHINDHNLLTTSEYSIGILDIAGFGMCILSLQNAAKILSLPITFTIIHIILFFWVEFSTLRDNTFDQLCINYCNERFQQYFVNLMLDQEKKWYNAQNLKVPFVQYLDNSQIIGMFYKILNSNRIMNDSMNYCLYHSN